MSKKLFWRDIVPTATVISTNGTADGFSVDSLKTFNLKKAWKSLAVETSEEIVIDLGSSLPVNTFCFLGHNLDTTADTGAITLEFADDAGFSVNPGSITLSAVTAPNWYHFTSSFQKQFWKLTIPKLGADPSLQIRAGRIMLGVSYEPVHGIKIGYTIGPGPSTSRKVRTQSGNMYGSLGVVPKILRGTFPAISDADFDEFTELQQTFQDVFPFVFAMDPEGHPERKTIYGTFNSTTPFTNVAVDKWDLNISMTEVL